MNELAYFKRDQPETKEQIKSYTESIIDQVINGNISALDVMKIVRRWKVVCETIESGIKPEYHNEALKLPKGHIENSYRFSQAQKPTWDYKHDQQWTELKAKLKSRETYLKELVNPEVNEQTGEIIAPAKKKIAVTPTMEIL